MPWTVDMVRLKLLPVVCTALLLGSCDSGPTAVEVAPGTLQGKVTIGPICPVEREGVPCPVPPEAYAARKILILDSPGRRLIETVSIGSDGRYRVTLQPGFYIVEINRIGIDSSKDLPKTVQVVSGETLVLDISIDTGIR